MIRLDFERTFSHSRVLLHSRSIQNIHEHHSDIKLQCRRDFHSKSKAHTYEWIEQLKWLCFFYASDFRMHSRAPPNHYKLSNCLFWYVAFVTTTVATAQTHKKSIVFQNSNTKCMRRIWVGEQNVSINARTMCVSLYSFSPENLHVIARLSLDCCLFVQWKKRTHEQIRLFAFLKCCCWRKMLECA